MVNPVDSAITGFYASAGLRDVLHDLPCANSPLDINLPEYHFILSCGTQHIVVGRFSNLKIGKMFAEESDEVGVEGEGTFQVFVRNVVGRFHWLVGLRYRK